MTPQDPQLDQLIQQIGQCLGRIDEHANRVVDGDDDLGTDFRDLELVELLGEETGIINDLIDSLVVIDLEGGGAAESHETVVDELLADVVHAFLAELQVPLVIRQNLTAGTARVSMAPEVLAGALQRALIVALSPLSAGDELAITTRTDRGREPFVLIEFEAIGAPPTEANSEECRTEQDRATTLDDFVSEFGGSCQVRSDQTGRLLLVLELPCISTADQRESA
ncbi:MAG: hypothetical protein AB8H80_04160 [Planctomycetota bacterium]